MLAPVADKTNDVRVLIVAEHASARFGGEAILPLHYFRTLRLRGVEAWLLVHARTKKELSQIFAGDLDRIYFIGDSLVHQFLFLIGKVLPARLRHFSTGYLSRLSSQSTARRVAKRMVREHQIDIIHQPIPVSPREPSLLYGLGVPVVIGPMNGGMSYPRGFRREQEGILERWYMHNGRWLTGLINRLMPGKLLADVLLVANERTRRALPDGVRGRVQTLVENGVDLSVWKRFAAARNNSKEGPVQFFFTGRLARMKGLDYLLPAFQQVASKVPATLDLLGDGPQRKEWERKAQLLGVWDKVKFHGWVPQMNVTAKLIRADVLVLPSLHECGGAVVLEAMAMGLPVIAADWGGPADYIDPSCGILIAPQTPDQFIADLAAAMLKLAMDPALRREMGRAGHRKIQQEYDWERKTDRILEIYQESIAGYAKEVRRRKLGR